MPYLKPINGHTSARFVQRYLEQHGRGLAKDFVNLIDIDRHGKSWSEQMDMTRALVGNDQSYKGRKALTYKHYVLSPDPRDNVSLEDMRDFALEWANKCFSDFEVAVVYHNDSKERLARGEEGIMHAHVVVNNTNLRTGGRIGSYLDNKRVHAINNLAQDMAKVRGWHNFLDVDIDEKIDIQNIANVTKNVTKQPVYRSREERSILSQTWSWKEEMRSRIDIARQVATNGNEFNYALELMSITLNASAKGDLLYQYTDRKSETHRITGMRLGADYSFGRITKELSGNVGYIANRPELQEDVLAAVHSLGFSDVTYLGTLSGNITIKDVAWALTLDQKYDIRSRSNVKRLATNPIDKKKLADVYKAHKILAKLSAAANTEAKSEVCRYLNNLRGDVYTDDGIRKRFADEVIQAKLKESEHARVIQNAWEEQKGKSSSQNESRTTQSQRNRARGR